MVWIALDPQRGQVLQGFPPAPLAQFARTLVASEDLCDLKVQDMRRVEGGPVEQTSLRRI